MTLDSAILSAGNIYWGHSLATRYEGTIYAPQFPEKLEWFNTESPLTLADLSGRLVILHFWTYC